MQPRLLWCTLLALFAPAANSQAACQAVGSDCEIGCKKVNLPNGLTFDCRVAGPASGQPVLLVHGFPTFSVFWEPLMRSWVRQFKSIASVACDMRGYARAAQPNHTANYSLAAQVLDVVGIANALQFQKFHLVGHDIGSAIGWAVAKHYPSRIYSYTALAVNHLDAWSRMIHGANADPEQQAMSQYIPAWAEVDSATKGAAWLMNMVGFTDTAQWQKVLWSYHNIFGNDLAMPPVMDNTTFAQYGSHPCCGASGLSTVSMQAANMTPAASSPQTRVLGPVDVPVTYICGSKDIYLKCSSDPSSTTANYTFLEVRCGHDLTSFGTREGCDTRSEQKAVFGAVTRMIETFGPPPNKTAQTAASPEVNPNGNMDSLYTRFEKSLLPNFNLYWTVTTTHLEIGIEAKTEGWVAFGIAEDTSGSMIGSDIVMAMVQSDGTVVFSDRHALDFSEPAVDCSQDWEAVSGSKASGWTQVRLRRLLDTQDGEDRPLVESGHGERIVVAYSNNAVFSAWHTERAAVGVWAFRASNGARDPLESLRADPNILQVEVRASPSDPRSRPYFAQTIFEAGGYYSNFAHVHTAGQDCRNPDQYRYCCINHRPNETAPPQQSSSAGVQCPVCGSGSLRSNTTAGYNCYKSDNSLIETDAARNSERGCMSAGGAHYAPWTCGDLQTWTGNPASGVCEGWVARFSRVCCAGVDHYLAQCPSCIEGIPIPASPDSYVDVCFSVNELFPGISAAPGDEWHIVGFEGMIDSISPYDTSDNVHHMTLDAYADDKCERGIYGRSGAAPTIYAWVKGTDPFAMPAEAGFTMSAPFASEPAPVSHTRIMSVALNLHYDNRNMDNSGALDNSGIRLFVSRTKRQHNAGVVQLLDPTVGLNSRPITAGQEGIGKLDVYCPGQCTATWTSPINVFYHFNHMHGAGVAMYNNFFRNNSRYSQAARIDWYDYTFEHASLEKLVIQPGDEIRSTCWFNTLKRREGGYGFRSVAPNSVAFGLKATDEMCISWLNYYPEQTNAVCGINSDCHRLMESNGVPREQLASQTAGSPQELAALRLWPGTSKCQMHSTTPSSSPSPGAATSPSPSGSPTPSSGAPTPSLSASGALAKSAPVWAAFCFVAAAGSIACV
uniref:DOMON domain-containing protein n=1 Tax=Alexandrium monilatum TaxID=311494 RepID=A0A7S4PT95_9DINO|mmetsp:Transcript_969/g.3222  ORF Transcript_969/g.3222 Transcript_969/m.3222 type:complete len:1119 (+) Transcript_969:110-3466(+)